MNIDLIKKLPVALQEIVMSEADEKVSDEIVGEFSLTSEQTIFLIHLYLEILAKEKNLLDLTSAMAAMPNAKTVDLRKLCLVFAQRQLWQFQEYLGTVDVIIQRLGGEVPAAVTPVKAVNTPQTRMLQGSAKEILFDNKLFNDLYLTKKPIRNYEDRLKSPTVANWLQDYLRTMGAEGSSTLKRSQYLVKSKNALILNDAEKANVLNFLISYDEGYPMYWRVAEGQYLLVDAQMPGEEKEAQQQKKSAQALDELIAYYKDIQSNYERLFEDKKKGIAIELDQKVTKLPDIVWDALGLNEQERCLTALAVLIEKGVFFDALKTDQRFRGIVLRAVTAHFGMEAKNFWNGDMSQGPILGIFWKLILLEKLGLDESRAAILSDWYTKKIGQPLSPMYLDLKNGSFKFREVKWENRVFKFV